jgi:esterase
MSGSEIAESHHAVVDGFRLHYLDWGGSGPDILFLHGGALTAHSWHEVCLALRDRYRCVALDQRGHGDSEWSPALDYGTDAHVRDLVGLTTQLGLDRFVLVGQSLGAVNGLTFAARHGERLAGLAMIDAGPWVRLEGARRVRDFVLMPAELPSVEDFVERAKSFNPRRDTEVLRRSLLHNLRPTPDGGWTWKYDRRHLSRESFEAFAAELPGLEAELAAVRCPVLVVRGEESDVFSAADARQLAERLPDGRAVDVPDAGHTVQGDNPLGLAREIDRFVRLVLA